VKAFARHVYCAKCWGAAHFRVPVLFIGETENVPCCVCGEMCEARIFVRAESALLLCRGRGPNHAKDGA